MFPILDKEKIATGITKVIVAAPAIAQKAQAGQFVVIIVDEKGERIPLTLADWDTTGGTITLIFQEIGFSTQALAKLEPGDNIAHILGPLGHPTVIRQYGEVICIAGGLGIAEVYPVARALKNAGNRVISIIGSRSADLLILEPLIRQVSAELFLTTDDGSKGRKGFVTDILRELFEVIEKSTHTQYPQLIYAIGPVPMMKAVARYTKDFGVKTIVSLNPIMVDATGMCGACRCTVAGKTVFGCVDGPDFDAHQIDFESLEKRLRLFKEQEKLRT